MLAGDNIRVVRQFADRPLAPEHLDRILNAARRTASSKNQQEWAFIVVRDRDHLKELTRVGRYADHLAGAAVAIALVTPDRPGSTLPWDLGRAAQNMVLVAWELGIGSVPATCHNKRIASELLGLPTDHAATSSCPSVTPPMPPSSRPPIALADAWRWIRSCAKSAGSGPRRRLAPPRQRDQGLCGHSNSRWNPRSRRSLAHGVIRDQLLAMDRVAGPADSSSGTPRP